MEINIIKDEKNELELQIDNQTIAELIREYLNKDSHVTLGVWKKEHYSKPLLLRITSEGKSAKKALQDAINHAEKDLAKYAAEFKKAG
jgi:DNA-directed RNA polymerase subunit L